MIKDEARYLCVAMGHGNESLEEFVEAHKTCLNDLMYFPTRNAYGLSSVAGNHEKLAALQDEFEYVKKKMDDDTEKAVRLEKKVKVLTHGYEVISVDYHVYGIKLHFLFCWFNSILYVLYLLLIFFPCWKYFLFDNWQICFMKTNFWIICFIFII